MDMQSLLKLIKSGESNSTLMLAQKMNTSVDDIERTLEYLERIGVLRKTTLGQFECTGCSSCSPSKKSPCKGCVPDGGFHNMGTIWEVADS